MYVEDPHARTVAPVVHANDVVIFVGGEEKDVALSYIDLAPGGAVTAAPRKDEGDFELRVPVIALLSQSGGRRGFV